MARIAYPPKYIIAAIVTSVLALLSGPVTAQTSTQTYTNERFGFTLRYPAPLFAPSKTSENDDGQTFISQDGAAKIVTYGALNSENFTPQSYRTTLMKEYGGYDLLDYQPRGKTWFVLSGFREKNIFYEKIMFSCAGKVINVLSITFPTEQKPFYEPVVEALEDNFRPGTGTDTPGDCR